MSEDGEYWYTKGYNPAAVKAVIVSGVIALASVIVPKLLNMLTAGPDGPVDWIPSYSWFVGCGAGFVAYVLFARAANVAGSGERPLALLGDSAR
jgi:NCS1 family nucleobase:cation symporter-1